MTSKQPESGTIPGNLARMGIMGVTTAGVGSTVAHGLDGAFPDVDGVDVTGLHGGSIDSGSVLHPGPLEGGEALDRPSAGYLAHSSANNGVELTQQGDVASIARDLDRAGTFTMDGQEIAVLDYIPGGDLVQMAGGSVNPSQLMMGLAQHGMREQMRGQGGSVSLMPEARLPEGSAQQGSTVAPDAAQDAAGRPTADAGATGQGGGSRIDASGSHVPDADENARDLEALALRHRLDLDTAVETSDQQRVHTEIHAHGRTLEMDTDFEATARSNTEERAEAAEHVEETAHAAISETEHTRPDMRFRSRIQAHLDAASQDEGMAI